jgi:hypothetical protein
VSALSCGRRPARARCRAHRSDLCMERVRATHMQLFQGLGAGAVALVPCGGHALAVVAPSAAPASPGPSLESSASACSATRVSRFPQRPPVLLGKAPGKARCVRPARRDQRAAPRERAAQQRPTRLRLWTSENPRMAARPPGALTAAAEPQADDGNESGFDPLSAPAPAPPAEDPTPAAFVPRPPAAPPNMEVSASPPRARFRRRRRRRRPSHARRASAALTAAPAAARARSSPSTPLRPRASRRPTSPRARPRRRRSRPAPPPHRIPTGGALGALTRGQQGCPISTG